MKRQESHGSPRELQAALRELYARPGFLLRRAHQISSALFMEETAAYGITTTQWGVLTVLAAREPIDQIGIATLLRLDRSTTGLVIKNLDERALIERVTDPDDRRRRVLRLTEKGRDLLVQIKRSSKAAHDRGLSVFDAAEAQNFVSLLKQFVDRHDYLIDSTEAEP